MRVCGYNYRLKCLYRRDISSGINALILQELTIKSRIMTKVIDYNLSIDTFEKRCVMFKGMLQSPQLKYHVQIISIDKYLSKNAIYEHKCLVNIKTLYKQACKCDKQKQFKDIIEAAMVSTTEVFTDNSPILFQCVFKYQYT